MGRTLIIGFGNILMGDDGAGIHAVQKLAACSLPSQTEAIDGGVSSFAALTDIHDAARVIFIDAMRGGGQPGTIYRLTLDNFGPLPMGEALSVHDFSLWDALTAYRSLGELPPIVIYGIEPETLEWGLDLSPRVSAAVETLIAKVLADIAIF